MSVVGPTLAALADDLAAGRTSARALTQDCLAAIDAPGGQGRVAFVHVDREGALAAADAIDAQRAAGAAPSRFAGIPIGVKDLFDVAGQVTRAGSIVLDGPPALADAPAVARLRAAGFVLIGRNNMTEFAFSGLGLNPHYGTPLSPWRRDEQHISGGSTSGGAAAVADAMAHAALGTDTGGSCRIPAAWCGQVGFKPTAARVSRSGAVPLSTTLDSVGPIGRSVACIAALDAILAGEADDTSAKLGTPSLRFAALENIALDGIEPEIALAYERALSRIEGAGAKVERVKIAALDRIPSINAKGGFAAYEAYAWHNQRLAEREADYDPRVAVRLKRGAQQDAVDYAELKIARASLIADMGEALGRYEALLMPTAPIAPPRLAEFADDEVYGRINLLALRNPSLVNMFDGCALSLPMHENGEPPAGLTLATMGGNDRRLLAVAQAVETALA